MSCLVCPDLSLSAAVLPKSRVMAVLKSGDADVLPWEWREKVQEIIYGVLGPAGKKVHESRYSLFSFSLLPYRPEFLPEGTCSKDGLWFFRFSSADAEVLKIFSDNFPRKVNVLGVAFQTLSLAQEPLSYSRSQFAAGPILAAKLKEPGFWVPGDGCFESAVRRSLEARWEFYTGLAAPKIGFSFIGSPRQKLIQYKGRNLLSFAGDIRLDAPVEMRVFAQCVGLGQKPSCGFGFLL